MSIFGRYLFRQLAFATLFTAVTLAAVILLTQSLRFLELVIDSGASSLSFWILTALALPRFFEIILPLALTVAIIFVYNRLNADSEMAVARSAGMSPAQLARPALYLAVVVTFILFFITTWLAPTSLSSMQNMRQIIKAQYSSLMLREGVFNSFGDDITVYIAEREGDGTLRGLIIHDTRPENDAPVTIIARSGAIITTPDTQQVLVYDGTRQDINPRSGALNNLQFSRYSIDLPESTAVRQRWAEPDERTLWQLLNPDMSEPRDAQNRDLFRLEAHRRIITPFLTFGYALIALMFMTVGPVDRRGQGKRISLALVATITLQAGYLGVYNMAQESAIGVILMDMLVVIPVLICGFMLSPASEKFRRRLLYNQPRRQEEALP